MKGQAPCGEIRSRSRVPQRFRVEKWDSTNEVTFRNRLSGTNLSGTIRRDPKSKDEIVVGSLDLSG